MVHFNNFIQIWAGVLEWVWGCTTLFVCCDPLRNSRDSHSFTDRMALPLSIYCCCCLYHYIYFARVPATVLLTKFIEFQYWRKKNFKVQLVADFFYFTVTEKETQKRNFPALLGYLCIFSLVCSADFKGSSVLLFMIFLVLPWYFHIPWTSTLKTDSFRYGKLNSRFKWDY